MYYIFIFIQISYFVVDVKEWGSCTNNQEYRKILVLFITLLGFVSKGTIFIELNVSINEECIGTLNEYVLGIADFLYENHACDTCWKFYTEIL
uniref:Endoplasmic reticulum membrane protein n=1 Tax=Strongyloides papillosus TaxID=174720 RepID=A0A0N5BQB1_STREA